jgi:hypothetical protein
MPVLKEAYGGNALDGDLDEARALALSPLETGRRAAATVPASELNDTNQLINLRNKNWYLHSSIKDKLTSRL